MDFNTLHAEFEREGFFDILENPPRPLRPYNNVYFMAFDAEWYQSGDKNVVLSYQIATVSRTCSKNIIEFVPPGKRLKLAEIVNLGVCSVNDGVIPDNHATARNLVVLISHSTVAEWSVLEDRDASYITKQLTAIRKSPVTGIYPIEIVLGDYVCPCHVQLYDTRLIAPADFQSLKKLSTLLGSEDELKVEIGHHHIKRMDRLIKIDYSLYEKYALQDSEITLKLFFLLQSTLMDLAGNQSKLYRTLASGAVKGFMGRAHNFARYQKALQTDYFKSPYKFIRSAYHGGRNEGYFVGRSDKYPEINNRLWVDIDFVGCYPTAMSLCPTIDCGVDPFAARTINPPVPVPGEIKYLPMRYHLPFMTDDELREAGINLGLYRRAYELLNNVASDKDLQSYEEQVSAFEKLLAGIEAKRDRERLRDMAIGFDNSLIDDWYERYRNDDTAERHIIPGFARVKFAFDIKLVDGKEVKKDKDTDYIPLYPCLPVSHPSFGLIYPIEGETYATAPEIMLALDAGCRIKAISSLELPVVMEPDSEVPKRLFFEHLADLTVKRNVEKKIIRDETKDADERQKAKVMERFIKEFMNSFYGKTAQAINYKKSYDPETGLMVALGPSPISEACTAALATGLPRSALSAMLLAIDTFNQDKPLSKQIIIASCTTDGLLVGLPNPKEIPAFIYYKSVSKPLVKPTVAGVGGGTAYVECFEMKDDTPSVNKILEETECEGLIPLIKSYMPIRQMRNARRELTTAADGKFDDTFLEIKHFADQIAGVKTRGQMGWVRFGSENIITIQAKFGLKPPVTDIIRNKYESECTDDDWALPYKRPSFDVEYRQTMKFFDDEYDRIMNAGGTAKATLECNWILEQIDRINSGEVDVFDYPFYGLKSFNEIIKGGDDNDLTQTKATRKFNADFDWKRKMIAIDGVVLPFTVPHQDVKEMQSYRGQVEKSHRWRKLSFPGRVIQQRQLAHSKTRSRGGEAAKLVRMFLSGMLFDHIPGGVKVGSGNRRDRIYGEIAVRITSVWDTLEFTFEKMTPRKKALEAGSATKPVKTEWSETDIKNIAREDKWEGNVVLPSVRLEELLAALCDEFQVDYDIAYRRVCATEIKDEPDMELLLQVVLAVLKAPGLGIEPFSSLYASNLLPTRAEIIREFQPHLSDSLLASYEHRPFVKGQCQLKDRSKLEQYFIRLKLKRLHAETCAQVLLPAKEARTVIPRNPGEMKCLRVFAQALHNIVEPPVPPIVIVQRLRKYGLNSQQVFGREDSKFERHSIKNTPENVKLIKKLAKVFALEPTRFLNAMLIE